ncbi:hypothetical protein KA478_05130 [Patescibacteria group bacterium]|nr:hypothetical protein [Patescibacteria group bacterium]
MVRNARSKNTIQKLSPKRKLAREKRISPKRIMRPLLVLSTKTERIDPTTTIEKSNMLKPIHSIVHFSGVCAMISGTTNHMIPYKTAPENPWRISKELAGLSFLIPSKNDLIERRLWWCVL